MSIDGNGRTALVTGGGGGIGQVTALEYARRGYRVAVCDLTLEACRPTVEGIAALGGDAQAFRCDVGDGAQVEDMVHQIVSRFGRLHVAFNNAGVAGGRKSLLEAEEADFDACLRTNLKGTWLCMKHEIRHMLSQGGGVIVNNSSIMGLNGGVGAAYTASKHGVVGLTKSAALVYASQNVRVNAVCPGLIDAGLGAKVLARFADSPDELLATIPARRPGSAQEVANAVLWLSSDSASYMNGHLLAVDGGYSAQ